MPSIIRNNLFFSEFTSLKFLNENLDRSTAVCSIITGHRIDSIDLIAEASLLVDSFTAVLQ